MLSRHKTGKKLSNTLPKPLNVTPTITYSTQTDPDHIVTWDSMKRLWKMLKNVSNSTMTSQEDTKEKELHYFTWINLKMP